MKTIQTDHTKRDMYLRAQSVLAQFHGNKSNVIIRTAVLELV